MCVFLTFYTHTLSYWRDKRRHAPAHKHSLWCQTLWPDRLPAINTDQFSSISPPDCLCEGKVFEYVYDSGDRLVTVCTNAGSRTSGGTHLRLVHTGRLTHSWFHQWEFTALTATTANHITAQRCFTMTTHYSMLHFIQLGLPRLKIQHTKTVGRERVFWGYAHRQCSVKRPKGATCMPAYGM